MAKGSRLLSFIGARLRITVAGERTMEGTFLAYDRFLNIILGDAEEFRSVAVKGGDFREDKRALGLVLVRGANVVSLQVVRPPAAARKAGAGAGPGAARAAGRGVSVIAVAAATATAPVGLAGPVRGVGGPAPAHMAPPPGYFAPPPPPGFAFPGMPMQMQPPPGFPGAYGMPPPGWIPPPGMLPPGMPHPMGYGPPPGYPMQQPRPPM